MYALLVTLLIIDSLLLCVVVLLQAGQGGGLASLGGGGGTDMVMGGRQAVTLLTTSTKWLGGIFMGLALILSFVAPNQSSGLTDVQRQLQQQAAPAPETTPSPLTLPAVPPPATPDTN